MPVDGSPRSLGRGQGTCLARLSRGWVRAQRGDCVNDGGGVGPGRVEVKDDPATGADQAGSDTEQQQPQPFWTGYGVPIV